ncbi:hypothetical protein Scep_007081 [Stephania cephalantha]|uniref:Uncharacterized protein n=1 Tax=Stephania cephalantha TaxID=152367 RepID=A0AAP0KB75_9MAGN
MSMLMTVGHTINMFIRIPIYVARMLPGHILMGGSRWCDHCLEVTEEPSSSRRSPACRGGAQLVTEEPSLSRRSPALQSKMGVWPWASMALGEYGLGQMAADGSVWRRSGPTRRRSVSVGEWRDRTSLSATELPEECCDDGDRVGKPSQWIDALRRGAPAHMVVGSSEAKRRPARWSRGSAIDRAAMVVAARQRNGERAPEWLGVAARSDWAGAAARGRRLGGSAASGSAGE